MNFHEIFNLRSSGVEISPRYSSKVSCQGGSVIVVPDTSAVSLYKISSGQVHRVNVGCDDFRFSPRNVNVGYSVGSRVYAMSVSKSLDNLSPSSADASFNLSEMLAWAFFDDQYILCLTVSGLVVCSVAKKASKMFIPVEPGLDLSNFTPTNLGLSSSNKHFYASGYKGGAPFSCIVTLGKKSWQTFMAEYITTIDIKTNTGSAIPALVVSAEQQLKLHDLEDDFREKKSFTLFENPGESAALVVNTARPTQLLIVSTLGMAQLLNLSEDRPSESQELGGYSPVTHYWGSGGALCVVCEDGKTYEMGEQPGASAGGVSTGSIGAFGVSHVSQNQTASTTTVTGVTESDLISLLEAGEFEQVAMTVVDAGDKFRTLRFLESVKNIRPSAGRIAPVIKYLAMLVSKTKLTEHETVEIATRFLESGKPESVKYLVDWFNKGSLEESEQFADLMAKQDPELAGQVYERLGSHGKRIGAFLRASKFSEIVSYTRSTGFETDYEILLEHLYKIQPEKCKEFAAVLLRQKPSVISVKQVCAIMLDNDDIDSYTQLMLKYFQSKGDLAVDADLQTNFIVTIALKKPELLKEVFNSSQITLTHFNRQEVGEVLEDRGLSQYALQCYDDESRVSAVFIASIKGLQISAEDAISFIEKQLAAGKDVARTISSIVDALDDHSRKVAELVGQILGGVLEKKCTNASLLTNMLVEKKQWAVLVSIFKPTIDQCTEKEVVTAYIQAAMESGEHKEAERICKESESIDTLQVKNYLLGSSDKDPRPLIFFCHRFNFTSDLVTALLNQKMEKFLIAYVQKIAPTQAHVIFERMISMGKPDAEIKVFLDNIKFAESDPSAVVQVFADRNMTDIIVPYLEKAVRGDKGNEALNTAMAKVYISERSSNAHSFIESSEKMDFFDVAEFAKVKNPALSMVAYKKCKADEEAVRVAVENGFYRELGMYLVDRNEPSLWAEVMNPERVPIDEIVSELVNDVLPRESNPAKISNAVKALIKLKRPMVLVNLLEKILITSKKPVLSDNRNLQHLLVLTAMDSNKSKVARYISELNNIDHDYLGKAAIRNTLYEEALLVYEKGRLFDRCVAVLVENLGDAKRAEAFAREQENHGASGLLKTTARLLLEHKFVAEALRILIEVKDSNMCEKVMAASGNGSHNAELVLRYLLQAKSLSSGGVVNSCIVAFYANTGQTEQLVAFLEQNKNFSVEKIAQEKLREEDYAMAIILYTHLNRHDTVAVCKMKTGDLLGAMNSAKIAQNRKVFEALLEKCMDPANEDKQITVQVGALVANCVGLLEKVVAAFEDRGLVHELVEALTLASTEKNVNVNTCTELGVALCKYQPQDLVVFLQKNWKNVVASKLNSVLNEYWCFPELCLLLSKNAQHDTLIRTMMGHAPLCFDETLFRAAVTSTSSQAVLLSGLKFVIEYKPELFRETINAIATKVDLEKVVEFAQEERVLFLVEDFLFSNLRHNTRFVNNELARHLMRNGHVSLLRRVIFDSANLDLKAIAAELARTENVYFKKIAMEVYSKIGEAEAGISIAEKCDDPLLVAKVAAASRNHRKFDSTMQTLLKDGLGALVLAMAADSVDWMEEGKLLTALYQSGNAHYALPFQIFFGRQAENRLSELENEVARLRALVKAPTGRRDSDSIERKSNDDREGSRPAAHKSAQFRLELSDRERQQNLLAIRSKKDDASKYGL